MPEQWWRRILLIVLVPVVSLSVVASTVAIWSHQTLLDTDRWVATTGPLLDDPTIVNGLSALLAQQIVTTLRIQERAQQALPDPARFLAAPIADAANRFVQTQATRFLTSDAGQQAWVSANRLAHAGLIRALRGESQVLGTANGMVTLDLLALPIAILRQMDVEAPDLIQRRVALPEPTPGQSPEQRRGDLARSLGVDIPPDFGQVALFPADKLADAQRALRVFDALAIASPLVAILLAVAALLLFRDRWLGALVLACGALVSFALVRVLLPDGIGLAISQIPRAGVQDFVVAAVRTLLEGLATVLTTGVLFSAAAAIAVALLWWGSRLRRPRAPAA